MIASINKKSGDVFLYSIYRDTYVQMELDGKEYYDKINHAYYNGPENTIKTINQNLDLNIDDYVSADFNAVRDLVNLVKGIELDIQQDGILSVLRECVQYSKKRSKKLRN